MLEPIKDERFWQWVERWEESEFSSPEYISLLLKQLRDFEEDHYKLKKIESLYKEQADYIKKLERQMELLQKTLELAEKFAPRVLMMPDTEKEKRWF